MAKKKKQKKRFKTIYKVLIALVTLAALFYFFGYPLFFRVYTGEKTWNPEYPNAKELGKSEFDSVAAEIKTALGENNEYTKHIEAFRKAGINKYEGPRTCLTCHKTMKVERDGEEKEIDTIEDVLSSVHFRLFSMEDGFSTIGYNGDRVNEKGRPIPVGKIDRACGMTGTFTWTGWADLIEAKPEHLHGKTELRSVGCGQCHIGGQFAPATELMLPFLKVTADEKKSIDCLICHSKAYDMNYKYVMEVEGGKVWNQDRSMKAAMTSGKPDAEMCLRCHQHNLGGDSYVNNKAAKAPGYKNRRLPHFGSKRATPYHEQDDVHAAMGMACTECHIPQGHKIPRGRQATDLVANDLPDVEVSCAGCHTEEPHEMGDYAAQLNAHGKYIACETCHIHELKDHNLILVDWEEPEFNKEEGVWEPKTYRSGAPEQALAYLWFNGKGTFLANALGSHPDKTAEYNPFMENLTRFDRFSGRGLDKRGIKNNDFLSQLSPDLKKKRKEMVEDNLREWMNTGESKIYPFKIFNARMHEDLANEGPFGAMILPYDYKIYHELGKPLHAVKKAMTHPIIRRMYGPIFKIYMMDKFMAYFGVDGWNTDHPFEKGYEGKVEPRWMRQVGTLMLNHGIQSEGLSCDECHSTDGRLDFEKLGYSKEKAAFLSDFEKVESKMESKSK